MTTTTPTTREQLLRRAQAQYRAATDPMVASVWLRLLRLLGGRP